MQIKINDIRKCLDNHIMNLIILKYDILASFCFRNRSSFKELNMNIVLLIIDTLRYDHIGAYGGMDIKTPNIDRLASKSWNFHRAFAASFPTIPHRTDVMTGLYGSPFHYWRPLAARVPTLPRALADCGYCSQYIHDTPHTVNAGGRFDHPFDAWTFIRGAEVDRPWITDSWELLPNWERDPEFDRSDMTMEEAIRRHHSTCCYLHANRHREKEEDWNTPRLFTAASQFLRDNLSRDNFFLWIDCFDPHEPWDPPPEYITMYDKTPGYSGKVDPRSFHHDLTDRKDISETAVNRIRSMYRADITFVDKWLGRFLDTLEETGLSRNTAVLLTSDHGTNMRDDERDRFYKTVPPRENEAHVPFMVSVPGHGAGDSDIIVQPQDIFATVMSIADRSASLPEEVESFDVLEAAEKGVNTRSIALTGAALEHWKDPGPETVLFSVFDRTWNMAFTADPAACDLKIIGNLEDVSKDNPDIVSQLHSAALGEIKHRGLDPGISEWIRGGGKGEFPAVDHPDMGPYGAYWKHLNSSLGIKENSG